MVYLDNAATTKISEEVLGEMLPWLEENYGNASAVYSAGRKSAIAISNARRICAGILGCDAREIYFTSGGTESDNIALRGAAAAAAAQGKRHIITSAFEHDAVLNTVKELGKLGFEITYLPVYENGIVRVSDVEKAMRSDTALVSVMAVNNEIGTIQPIAEIGALCRSRGVLFHTDAVQAAGNIRINVREQNIDLLSVSGHKIHAMKGTGLLYVRGGVKIVPVMTGGGQEKGLRSGTENTAGIVGLAAALKYSAEELAEKQERLTAIRDRIIDEVLKIDGARLSGDRERRVCSIAGFTFDRIEGEALVLQLDLKDIAVSSGSACAAGNTEPSHVLTALGLSKQRANASLRISMSKYTTDADADRLLEVLPVIIEKLRALTPPSD